MSFGSSGENEEIVVSIHTCPRCPLRFTNKAELMDHLDVDHHVPSDMLSELRYPGAHEAEPLYRTSAADDGVHSVLLIANQTLRPDRILPLLERIEHADEEPLSVYVLVPATPERLLSAPTGDAPVSSQGWSDLNTQADDAGVATARYRLRNALKTLQEAGITAHGSVGDPNPVASAAKVMAEHPIDEILVSTLTRGHSRWLHADLPTALRTRFGLPVTVVSEDDVAAA